MWSKRGILIAIICVAATSFTSALHAQTWSDWTDGDFVALWGQVPIENVTTMTILHPDGVQTGDPDAGECPPVMEVGVRFGQGGAAAGGEPVGWDLFGEITDTFILPIPHLSAFTDYQGIDPITGVEVAVEMQEMLIAATLTGSTGISRHVSGLIAVVQIQELIPDGDEYANAYFAPIRVWDDIADAHVDVVEIYNSYLVPAHQFPFSSSSEWTGHTPIGGSRDCLQAYLDAMDACQEQWDEDLADCIEEAVALVAACQMARDNAKTIADAELQACLDNVGLWEAVIGACGGAASGAGIGGAVGACFAGIGAKPGGVIGLCVGGIGGFFGGKAWAREQCRRAHAIAYANANAAYNLCVQGVQNQFDNCVDAASDALDECMDAAEEVYHACECERYHLCP